MADEIVKLPSRVQHRQPGLYALADLPQRPPVDKDALSTGWWELDQIFKLYPGQFTMCTGLPGHGKSTFLLNLIAQVAVTHGTRSFLYVPENEGHIRAKLRRLWAWSDEEFKYFCSEQCFVQSALNETYNEPPRTLQWVLDRAIVAIEKNHVDLLMIDPWNELEWARPKDQTMTDYIADCLKDLKYFARCQSVAILLVAHPTKSRVAGSGPVTLADIEGSMHWYNKCDNGLIVEREPGTNTTKVISAKVREKGAGKVGCCFFYVDPETEQFTPQHGAVG